MFRDRVRINLKAGTGGNGRVTFGPNRTATGGQGGDGGSLYVVGDNHQLDLGHLMPSGKYKAEDGDAGGVNNLTGANGKDYFLKVPIATVIYNVEGEKIAEVTEADKPMLLLKGGIGGMGNYYYSRHSRDGHEKAKPGEPGAALEAKLELELVSDVIFIGLPNAGKSSLLNFLTNADAKVGAYAFTTTIPQPGRMDGITLMDLPGLIAKTHEGKGLGTGFIKHTRRSRLVAHCLSLESEDLAGDYKIIRNELEQIDPALAAKPEIVLLTKSDMVDAKEAEAKLKVVKKLNPQSIVISSLDEASLETLKALIRKSLA
jgi:GTPase